MRIRVTLSPDTRKAPSYRTVTHRRFKFLLELQGPGALGAGVSGSRGCDLVATSRGRRVGLRDDDGWAPFRIAPSDLAVYHRQETLSDSETISRSVANAVTLPLESKHVTR